jgi:hypothetical protein
MSVDVRHTQQVQRSPTPAAVSDEVSPRAKRIAGTVKRALQMIVRILEKEYGV